MFIAEQQLIAAAVGMRRLSLGAVRVHVRRVPLARLRLRADGGGLTREPAHGRSHAGVSIGEDGPSQMALEDMASIRAIHGSTVLHPSDANQASQLVAAMAERRGISYMRTLRGKTRVRTDADEPIAIGGSRQVCVHGDGDELLIIACGITVGEAEEAAEQLAATGTRSGCSTATRSSR